MSCRKGFQAILGCPGTLSAWAGTGATAWRPGAPPDTPGAPRRPRHGDGPGAGGRLEGGAPPHGPPSGGNARRTLRRRRGHGPGREGIRTLRPHRRAGPPPHRWHGLGVDGWHGEGPAGDLSHQGRPESHPLPDPAVTMEHVPEPHHGATVDRARRGAAGDARHRGLPGGGHRPAPHHAGTAGHRDVVRPPDGQAPDIRTSVIDPGCAPSARIRTRGGRCRGRTVLDLARKTWPHTGLDHGGIRVAELRYINGMECIVLKRSLRISLGTSGKFRPRLSLKPRWRPRMAELMGLESNFRWRTLSQEPGPTTRDSVAVTQARRSWNDVLSFRMVRVDHRGRRLDQEVRRSRRHPPVSTANAKRRNPR